MDVKCVSFTYCYRGHRNRISIAAMRPTPYHTITIIKYEISEKKYIMEEQWQLIFTGEKESI